MYPEPNCTQLLSLSHDLSGECGAECEMILPDYCPNILRILQTTATVSILSKTVNADRLTVEGKAEYRILYLAEDGGGFQSASQQTLFSCTMDRKQNENTEYTVKAKIQNCAARALNPRKIFVRCTVQITAKADGNQILKHPDSMENYEQKPCRETVAKLLCSAEKPLRISDDFEGENRSVAKLLQTHVFFRETEQKPLTDKLIVKADMMFDLLCADENGRIFPLRKTLPISQILDLPGLETESICHVGFEPIFVSITPPEEGKTALSYDVEVNVSCKCYAKTSAAWTEDVFSVKKTLECEKETVSIHDFIPIRETGPVRETVEIGMCSELLWAEATPDLRQMQYDSESDRILCHGLWNCRILMIDGEGSPAALQREIPFTLAVPAEGHTNPVRNDTEMLLSDLTWTQTDANHMELRGNYHWSGLIFTEKSVKIITQTKEVSDRPKDTDTVILYYAEAGESAWDIAKEHACPYKDLQRENALLQDKISENKMLILLR